MLENKVAKGQKHGKRCWKQLELNILGLLKRGILQNKNQKFLNQDCGNCMFFLLFRFCVKLHFGNLERQILPFQHILRHWLLIFVDFCTFSRLRFTKLSKFRVPKTTQTAVLELLDSPKLISRKIWMTEKSYEIEILAFWNYLK